MIVAASTTKQHDALRDGGKSGYYYRVQIGSSPKVASLVNKSIAELIIYSLTYYNFIELLACPGAAASANYIN